MNLADELAASAGLRPDAVAVRSGTTAVAYGELDAGVDAAAAALAGLGVAPGDRVAVMLGNTDTFVRVLYGIWRLGAVAVPVNTGFTAREAHHLLTDSGARVVVVSRAYHAVVLELRDRLPAVEQVVVADAPHAPGGTGMVAWREVLETAEGSPPRPPDGDRLALLQYTAGTTGRPKGVMLTHGNLLANHRQMRATPMGPTEQDVLLCALPLFHIYALNVGLALTLGCGAELVLRERFDPVSSVEAIREHGVTIVLGAPPMYVAWLNTPGVTREAFASVRLATSGAAALDPVVLRRCAEELDLDVWEGYGLTETSPSVASTVMLDAPRPGAVGRALPGVEIRVLDASGDEAAEGDPGVVQVRGDHVFAGYWHDVVATAAVLDDEGWFTTGDLGYLVDGVLHLVSRADDLIIVSGFNVYPREVEEALTAHPDIDEAAVVGVPHPYSGQAVQAVVVRRPGSGITADEVIAHSRARLARFKCPEVVDFVDALPVLPTGKVRRASLREGSG